jgi:hypothetical protein
VLQPGAEILEWGIFKCLLDHPRCLMRWSWPGGPRIVRLEYGGHSLCCCWSGPLVSAMMRRLPGSRATGRLTVRARLLRPLTADGAGGPWQSWLQRVGAVPLLLHCECSRDWCSCAGGAHFSTPAFAGALANERPSISYECWLGNACIGVGAVRGSPTCLSHERVKLMCLIILQHSQYTLETIGKINSSES